MTLRTIVSVALGLALGAALIVAEPANAAANDKKQQANSGSPAKRSPAPKTHVWSGGINGNGPLYFGQDYLGTDPDPNIRFQILRDITGHYGGGGD